VTPSIVVLGNLIVDDVVFDDGSTRMVQPGARYSTARSAPCCGITASAASASAATTIRRRRSNGCVREASISMAFAGSWQRGRREALLPLQR
jgi:hypothetical protein